jgi:signal transduction histidine kinase
LVQNGVLATWEVDRKPPRGLIAIDSNVTASKTLRRQLKESEMARIELSRRMINAQEADRIRISRELHDDIGQSLAVLKIQMLRALSRNPVKAKVGSEISTSSLEGWTQLSLR